MQCSCNFGSKCAGRAGRWQSRTEAEETLAVTSCSWGVLDVWCILPAAPVLPQPCSAIPWFVLQLHSHTDPFLDRQFPLEDASVRTSSLLLPAPGWDGKQQGHAGPPQHPCAPSIFPVHTTGSSASQCSRHRQHQAANHTSLQPLLATQTAAETSPQTLPPCLQCELISMAAQHLAQHLAHPPAPQHRHNPAGPP